MSSFGEEELPRFISLIKQSSCFLSYALRIWRYHSKESFLTKASTESTEYKTEIRSEISIFVIITEIEVVADKVSWRPAHPGCEAHTYLLSIHHSDTQKTALPKTLSASLQFYCRLSKTPYSQAFYREKTCKPAILYSALLDFSALDTSVACRSYSRRFWKETTSQKTSRAFLTAETSQTVHGLPLLSNFKLKTWVREGGAFWELTPDFLVGENWRGQHKHALLSTPWIT